MKNIFSMSFWVNLFFTTFFTMLMIYLIKKASATLNVPIVSDIANVVQ